MPGEEAEREGQRVLGELLLSTQGRPVETLRGSSTPAPGLGVQVEILATEAPARRMVLLAAGQGLSVGHQKVSVVLEDLLRIPAAGNRGEQ